ncbi:MAG: GNAT family N-acetyltransferase [Candidatus Delongbacteria bacterium]
MGVEVTLVRSAADWRDFLALPDSIQGGDPDYTRAAPAALRRRLEAMDSARHDLWLVRREGQPIARVGAWLAEGLTGVEGVAGLLGLFESRDDLEAARPLLRAAREWLRQGGARAAFGPLDGDTWHRYRFNLGPRDTRPFLLEPVNPPWYPQLWLACGFTETARYLSKQVPDMAAVLPAFAGAHAQARAAGYRFRPLDPARFEQELELLHQLACRIFPVNPFYSPSGLEDFRDLYRPLKPVLDPGLVWFCHDRSGAPAAFLFSLPDQFEALRSMRGRCGPLARLRFWLRRHTDTLNIKSMGVCPEQRGQALGTALIHQAFAAGLERGLHRANLCLMHESNRSTGYDAGLGVVSRRYALYRHDLEGAT